MSLIGRALMGLVLGLVLAGCGAKGSSSEKEATLTSRPNVIFIVANDLGAMDISALPGGRFKTPNIDRLAKSGVVFAQAYSSSSASGPARAGLLTGRHPNKIGYEYDNGPGTRDDSENLGLPVTEVTLAQVLQDTGYKTSAIGVWGLGGMHPNNTKYPTQRGFADFYGSLTGNTAYVSAPNDKIITAAVLDPDVSTSRSIYESFVQGKEASPVSGTGYSTDDFTRQAVSFINQNKKNKFFLYLAFNAPGAPLQAPKAKVDQFASIQDPTTRVYAAAISALDDAVGQILATLDRQGLSKNTLIIFTSDKGCNALSGVCDCTINGVGGPTFYEGGLRVPLIVRWPASLPPGIFKPAVSTLDLFTTAMTATGTPRPPGLRTDSLNLLPYLRGEKTGNPREMLFWLRRPLAAIRVGDWKFIDDPDEDRALLFNLATDPTEQANLADSNPDKLTELRTQLTIARANASDPLWLSRGKVAVNACGISNSVFR